MAHALRFTLAAALVAVAVIGAIPRDAHAGPYTRLQVLLPGETAAPGSSTGKTGTPQAQTSGVPFTVTVRACDDTWTTVATVTNAVAILASDASATLPPTAQLVNGQGTWTVTFNAGGTFTVYAHDETDGTIPDGTSATVRSLVLQGFEFSRITQKNQYAGAPMTVSLYARDPNGGLVTGYSGPVRLREITSFGDGRTSPEVVTLVNGTWTGGVTMYRADETSINRGNVNLYAYLEQAPAKNGTSDPFTVHPGTPARVQIVVPGETPLPGSVSGKSGTPATQGAGRAFNAGVYATDNWWNPVPSADQVRISSSDNQANTPLTGALVNGFRQFSVSLGTVGTQTLTVSDLTNGAMTGMTSPPITVIPSAVDHFVVSTIASPVTAGEAVAVTIRAADANGNTIPDYAGDARLAANTGAGSISPESIAFTGGTGSGNMRFFGAGGAVSFTCSDFAAPPNTGTSNTFTVEPGALARLQVLVPGETAEGGTPDGKTGAPLSQQAGSSFTLTVRGVDAYWNLVPGVADRIALGSTDAFAAMPAETTLATGQRLLSISLARSGPQRIWASAVTNPGVTADTSSAITVVGGPFARVLVLAPGESPAPGTESGRTGTATDQSINFAFTCTVLATDQWWNPVGGVSDVVRLTSDDPLATLPPDQAMVDGRAEMTVRLARGGYNQITVSDVTNPAKTGSSTQVRAITSGFHLEASIVPATARAGEPFTVTVKVTNDAGSVIQEINSFVTLEVQNASTRQAGRGTLLTTQFQLLQGQRTVSETYTFVEPIVIVARDDAGNAPATTNAITITPGAPATIRFTSSPPWVGGNKHALLTAHLVDAFDNAVPGEAMVFQHLSGSGTLTPMDSLTDAGGDARADFLSQRQPGRDRLRASTNGLVAELDLETAFVDPNAAGGTLVNYPNPFHPPVQGTTFAWKLDDHATVKVRIYSMAGALVLEKSFDRAQPGGLAGLNEWVWDGRNGDGALVSSGAYTAFVEAQGTGETMHVAKRRVAVVR